MAQTVMTMRRFAVPTGPELMLYVALSLNETGHRDTARDVLGGLRADLAA